LPLYKAAPKNTPKGPHSGPKYGVINGAKTSFGGLRGAQPPYLRLIYGAKYEAKTSCGGLRWAQPPYLRRKNGTYGMHTQTPYWGLRGLPLIGV